jgi:hypothetical protein
VWGQKVVLGSCLNLGWKPLTFSISSLMRAPFMTTALHTPSKAWVLSKGGIPLLQELVIAWSLFFFSPGGIFVCIYVNALFYSRF